MPALEVPFEEKMAETAHWGDEPPIRIEEQELDLLAFELWHLSSYPPLASGTEDDDEKFTVASRGSCL